MRLAFLVLAALILAGCSTVPVQPGPLVAPTDPTRSQSDGLSNGVDVQAPAEDPDE